MSLTPEQLYVIATMPDEPVDWKAEYVTLYQQHLHLERNYAYLEQCSTAFANGDNLRVRLEDIAKLLNRDSRGIEVSLGGKGWRVWVPTPIGKFFEYDTMEAALDAATVAAVHWHDIVTAPTPDLEPEQAEPSNSI